MTADERTRLIAEKREDTGRTHRLWCKDEWRYFPVFRVPVEALLLNIDNRRFAADKTLVESWLGRSLDPENNTDDEASVISILLDTSLNLDGNRVKGHLQKEAESLTEDWLRRKQESPFWIRPDGTVRNGNRRLAVIKRLQEQGGHDGLEWVETIILAPTEIDEEDLFKMEQREQLTENLKVRYTDINLLLALREAAVLEEIDWADEQSLDKVAGELQLAAGGDKQYAAIQLRAIRYMDAYLADLAVPGEYHRLRGQVERFRDVGKTMAKIEADYPQDAVDMLRLAFAAIQAGNPHGDIRVLRKIFLNNRAAYEALNKKVAELEDAAEVTSRPELENPDLSVVNAVSPEEDDSDGEEDDTPGPNVRNYPGPSVKKEIKNAIDAFKAPDLDVHDALVQARSRLHNISPDKLKDALLGLQANDVRGAALDILTWASEAKLALDAGS